ncbi:MAG: GntR family transcriptional regulator [Lactobacillus sp.]|nr:GntR family transcriptional regulator [Lactobacillus sp.]
MNFNDNIPIYLQIQDYLLKQIFTEKLKPGERIPSIRQLALDLTVNINTIQHALKGLTDQEILITKRGDGKYVTTDQTLLDKLREQTIKSEINEFSTKMQSYGVSNPELVNLIERYVGGKNDAD